MRLYLVRHPRPDVSPGVCYGRSDLGLAEGAAVCAARLAPLLPAGAPVFSSPLRRCRQLAETLHPVPHIDSRLAELDFGAWEMRAWDAIDRAALDAWAANPLHFKGHGGESVAELRHRVAEFFHDHGQIEEMILVTHGGVMKACAGLLGGLSDDEWMGLSFAFGSVSLLGEGRLLWHNRGHGS
ncbi:phosphoglycerate mutase [bacterium]|nr:phosphoglycerate mutase [bacterium]